MVTYIKEIEIDIEEDVHLINPSMYSVINIYIYTEKDNNIC